MQINYDRETEKKLPGQDLKDYLDQHSILDIDHANDHRQPLDEI